MIKAISPARGVYQVLTKSSLRNFTYMVLCAARERGGEEWICIDPYDGEEVEEWLREKKGRLRAIVNTHEHWDHIRGNAHLVKCFRPSVYVHYKAKDCVAEATHLLSDGDIISAGEGRALKAIDTPGHTFAGLTYMLVEGERPCALFTGDTLFNAGVGNCRNGGDPRVLFHTIGKIYGSFPDDLLIYPGHEYLGNNLRFTLSVEPENAVAKALLKVWEGLDWTQRQYLTDLAEERQINTFLRLDNPSMMALWENGVLDEEQVFLKLRKKRDKW